jgi:hypothetical protein
MSPGISIFYGLILAIFVGGLALGFLGRPLVLDDPPVEVEITAVPDAEGQAATHTDQGAMSTAAQSNNGNPDQPVAGDDASASSSSPTIMDLVLADARHFEGDAAAPVTLIEFSDFK